MTDRNNGLHLRKRVAMALSARRGSEVIWEEDYEAAAVVIAALGLDDLDAAVERGARALARCFDYTDVYATRAVLEAALTTTEGEDG